MVAAAAILVCAGACSTDRSGGVADSSAPVDPSAFQTYSSYNGYRRAQIPEFQFTTESGVRCRIGPDYPDYDRGIRCWGTLPGVAPTVNYAGVSKWPYDAATHTMIMTRPIPEHGATYSFLDHVDGFHTYETYLDGGLREHPVDPSSYRLLGPGQTLAVRQENDSTSQCTVGTDDTLTCEIQTAEDKMTHGFRLASSGSHAY